MYALFFISELEGFEASAHWHLAYRNPKQRRAVVMELSSPDVFFVIGSESKSPFTCREDIACATADMSSCTTTGKAIHYPKCSLTR